MQNRRLMALVFALTLTGCAGFTDEPLDARKDAVADGIRYYEPAPFLIVSSDGKGNVHSEIRIMPDLSRKRVIDLYAFAAKNSSTLTFQEGMLIQSDISADTTAVPSALINTIKTLGTTAIASAFNSPHSGTVRSIPAPYIFKIVVGPEGTKLVGSQGVGPDKKPLTIWVNVTKDAVESEGKGGPK